MASIKPQEQLSESKNSFLVIQQNMRVSEMIKLATQHVQPVDKEPPTQELKKTFQEWIETQKVLQQKANPDIAKIYAKAEIPVGFISSAIENLLFIAKHVKESGAYQAFTLQIIEHEREYRQIMSQILMYYQTSESKKMRQNLLILIVGVITFSVANLLIGIFVFRPLHKNLQQYINDLETTQEELIDIQLTLNQAQETANMASIAINTRTNEVSFSPYLFTLLQMPTNTQKWQDIIQVFETGQQNKLITAIQECTETTIELYAPQLKKHILYQGKVTQTDPPHLIATFLDITKQKQTEETLRQQEQKLKELNENLEKLVQERTLELQKALDDLQSTQSQLVNSEKMASLGLLVAGIAHELNTPVSAIKSSAESIDEILPKTLTQAPLYLKTLNETTRWAIFYAVSETLKPQPVLTTRERRQIKLHLLNILEQYEFSNPEQIAETFILCGLYQNIEKYLPLMQEIDLNKILPLLHSCGRIRAALDNIKLASEKCQKINNALKNYSRQQHHKEEMISTNLAKSIDTILTIYQNQLKHGIQVIQNIQENLPDILTYEDELNQVWTNLIQNAIYAMEGIGILTIEIYEHNGNEIAVSIIDSGKGIPPEVLPHIFKPFFTTKPKGEGTGLGLDICKKIIDKHEGRITVESEPGKTKFTVFLPKKVAQNQGIVERKI
ncbi:MAG: ATP-binding protein [Bacteroidia bacterium]|nr:ATP-binding protein [Bacteroidia bacterium]MDW8346983.1 ATP-binding protein [Bacteroidia bacterium]